jgi:polyphosphate kinase 2 (PPK2 family)
VIVLLEGRDGSGKTTTARDVAAALGPSRCRVVALARPTSIERRAFYFRRWFAHLPSPGGVVVFDRSWYNRALVERVMGYCSPLELAEFFHRVPRIEADLVRRGYVLAKFFLTVGRDEQTRRLGERRARGELSVVDASALSLRDEYARAEEEVMTRTSTQSAPWTVLPECEREERCAAVVAHVAAAIETRAPTVAP